MRLSRKDKESGDIDISAFSDLAFLLIIFFVLTTTFVGRMGTDVTIPSSTSDPENKPQQELPRINLSSERILLDENPVTMGELRGRLIAMRLTGKPEGERVIILESAPDVRFERYFNVVTAISKAGGILALVEKVEGMVGG